VDAALAASGDQAAFGAIYGRHVREIHDFLALTSRDASAAGDLTKQTFLQAAAQLRALDRPKHLRAWFFGIADVISLGHLGRARPASPLQPSASTADDAEFLTLFGEAAAANPPVGGAEDEEAADIVWAAATSMDAEQYSILDLSVRRQLTTRELAEGIGITAAQATVLVHQSKVAFRGAVQDLFVARRRHWCRGLAFLVPVGQQHLSADRRPAVEHHVSRCEYCRPLAERLMRAEAILATIPLIELSADLAGRDWPQIAGEAAAGGNVAGESAGTTGEVAAGTAAAVGIAAGAAAVGIGAGTAAAAATGARAGDGGAGGARAPRYTGPTPHRRVPSRGRAWVQGTPGRVAVVVLALAIVSLGVVLATRSSPVQATGPSSSPTTLGARVHPTTTTGSATTTTGPRATTTTSKPTTTTAKVTTTTSKRATTTTTRPPRATTTTTTSPSTPTTTPPGPPEISALSPNNGAQGTTMTISGTDFGTGGNVTFYQEQYPTPASVSKWSNDSITVNVPAGLVAGGADVYVESAGLYTQRLPFTVNVFFSGVWKGKTVSLSLDSGVKTYTTPKGSISGFRTDDAEYACLNGRTLTAYLASKNAADLVADSSGMCVSAEWTFSP
jgi:DNA-directed RNA polymerase specialized sigma24 family protein